MDTFSKEEQRVMLCNLLETLQTEEDDPILSRLIVYSGSVFAIVYSYPFCYLVGVASMDKYDTWKHYLQRVLIPTSMFLGDPSKAKDWKVGGVYMLDFSTFTNLHDVLRPMPMIRVTKQFSFSYSHRLTSEAFTIDQNRTVFGKCNNPNGHGHNAILEVTVKGYADINTGMLLNFVDLKSVVSSVVDDIFDHHDLNLDLADLYNGKTRTCENTLPIMWGLLFKHLPNLEQLRLSETDTSWCTITREDMDYAIST